jgi:hypothetical protein
MNGNEARAVLEAHLESYRSAPYRDLVALIARGPDTAEIRGASAARYQLEIVAVWDSAAGGDVHIIVSIDDGGWRAFVPVTDGFIMRPDGSLVGDTIDE